MRKIKISLFFLSLAGVINAQSLEQQKNIVSSYEYQKIEQLKGHITENKAFSQAKIDAYLSENPKASQYFKKDNINYRIIDVVEGKPILEQTFNASAGRAVKVNHLYPGGALGLNLEGQGMNIALWDGGWVLNTHVEFNNTGSARVTFGDAPVPNPIADMHGTHVGGTIAAGGVNSSSKGMAPKANLISYNWEDDDIEVVTQASQYGLLISNHSYGVPIYSESGAMNVPTWYMGCYNSTARLWDQIAYNHPYYLMVASAGNSGTDSYSGGLASGYDKLTGNKNSKNNLVVANANPTVHPITGNLQSLEINPGSSQGPTDDGRIKPDIAADGTAVYSTSSSGVSQYVSLTGTSMSSPSVAGSLLLIQEHYNDIHPSEYMKAATLKGLVCHTAIDDNQWPGPDPRFGWGLLDARESVITLNNSVTSNPTAIVEELVLNQGETYSTQVVVHNPKNLKATISWTDLPGLARDGQTNSPASALVNDLDLRIIKEDGEIIHYPWKLQLSNVAAPAIKGDNMVDNLERVEVGDAVGVYTIQVSHKGMISGGSQAFSLIITGFDSTDLTIQDDLQLTQLRVYPNPTNDILNFQVEGNLVIDKVELYDLVGKRVFVSTNIEENNSINISELNSGVYFAKIYSKDSYATHKIIKR